MRGETLNDMSRREFELLFERAVRQAQRILGDRQRAEDVAAEALSRVLTGSKREHFNLIVHGLTVDAHRKLQKESPADTPTIQYLEDKGSSVLMQHRPVSYEDVEFRTSFDQALRELPVEDRDAFVLTELRGLTQTEAADLLGVNQSTVHRRAERARHQIKEMIA